MTDLIDQFCAFYHPYHNIGRQRRVMQLRVLRDFESSLDCPIGEAGSAELRAYLGTLVADYKPSTIRERHNAITPFFAWMWENKHIDAERLMEVREVRSPRGGKTSRPKPYKRTEIQRFWRDLDVTYPWCACGRCPETPQAHAELFLKRWRTGLSEWKRVEAYFARCQVEAIASFALMGGLRRVEVFTLNPVDVHPENDYIVVRGAAKNADAESVARPVPWGGGDWMRYVVGRWLMLRAELAPDHDALWLSLYRDGRLQPMYYTRFKNRLARIGGGYEYHRMRHTFATEALRAGMEIERLQKVLGHARIQQTLEYAKLLTGDIVLSSKRVEGEFTAAVMPKAMLPVAA